MIELRDWLTGRASRRGDRGRNKGGTIEKAGVKITLVTRVPLLQLATTAQYRRRAAGLIVELEDGKKAYFAGDTCVFGDMQLIGRSTSPTSPCCRSATTTRWGPRRPAVALELLGDEALPALPLGNLPAPDGNADQLKEHAPSGVEI
jgi:hypothetical protein